MVRLLAVRHTGVVTPEQVLRDVFHLESFRPGQAEVVDAQMNGRDVLAVAPTGSGKSLSYWVPAILSDGLTVVVSPLIALMKDQVDRLESHGVRAAFINSTLDSTEQRRRLEAASRGEYQLVYVAPERFSRPGFTDRLATMAVRRFIVDEAHCISTWGHDFRPDYRLIGGALEACGRPPIGAFTATATPEVRDDIASNLGCAIPWSWSPNSIDPTCGWRLCRPKEDATALRSFAGVSILKLDARWSIPAPSKAPRLPPPPSAVGDFPQRLITAACQM